MSRSLGPADSRSASFEIAPGGTLDFGAVYLAAEFAPEEVRIAASFAAAGESSEASVSLRVRSLDDETAYRLPLEGSWYMRGIPSALSHHRWSMATEFAVDFFKTDAEGRLWDGDPVDAPSYFGWAAPVLAAADGVVEMVIADMSQDRRPRMQQPGESREDYGHRLGALNQAAFQEHGLGGATGNLVVIRHEDGYRSAYAHLRDGSVLVAPGDRVRAGQKIAEVGDTGDSHHVHLHFQIMEAEAMRAVPFRFSDVNIRSREYGSWIRPQ
jgi:murein DD-endopeptidase MepM/ murein hydrolase activator NlpD